jgi:hypothetical protein
MPFDGKTVTSPLIEGLEKMYELLQDPQHWAQGSFAYTKLGRVTDVGEKCAFSFCLLGAGTKVGLVSQDEVALALGFDGPGDVVCFNDAPDREHKEILDTLEWALDRERSKLLNK